MVSFSYYNKFYKEYDSDSIYTTWLRVTCTGNFGDKTLDNFKIKNIEEYFKKGSNKPLDGDLVPIGDKYDEVAEAFLLKYYPEGLNEDKPIDLNKLIANMGLKIIYKRITKDLSVFGQSYFTKAEGEFYDSEKEDYYEEEIEENTIVLDSLAHALFSFSSPSITVIHKCLHFFLHKKAFKFVKIYNKNLNYIACATNGVILNISNNDRSRWIKIEANGIVPHILMPKDKLLGLYYYYKDFETSVDGNFSIYMPKIIFDISNRLNVSVYSVKKDYLRLE